MNNWVIALLVVCVIVWMLYYKKAPTFSEPLTIERKIQDYILEPVQGQVNVKKDSEPIYVIDNTDVIYYENKQKDTISKFEKELQERGIKRSGIVQELAQEPLQDYILDELLGNNLRDEYELLVNNPRDDHGHLELGNNPRDDPNLPRPDTQSVHDTNVQGTLKKVYNGITTVSKEPNRIFRERDVLLLAEQLGVDLRQVSRVIAAIKGRSSIVSNYSGDQEYTVLANTWKAGNDNVREQIVRNLAECVETTPLGTNVVCPTGVTSRIVESALINSPELMPRTRETLIQEMLSKANAVRTKLEKEKEYQDLSDASQSQVLKEALMETYLRDYLDLGILSEEQIDEHTRDWISHV